MSAQQPVKSVQLTPLEKKRKADLYARMTYGMVIVVFVSIVTIAVVASMNMEKEREGFRPIEVSKPISFFDDTLVKDKKSGH